jgi:hypothetical protein
MSPEPVKHCQEEENIYDPMMRIEPRFYDCPGRSVTEVPRLFTIAEELNKERDIYMILLVQYECVIQVLRRVFGPKREMEKVT